MVKFQFYLLRILEKVMQAHFYVLCSLLDVDILSRKWLDVYFFVFLFWGSHRSLCHNSSRQRHHPHPTKIIKELGSVKEGIFTKKLKIHKINYNN